MEEAHAVEDAGAFSLLLEAIPMSLAERLQKNLQFLQSESGQVRTVTDRFLSCMM